MQTSNVSRVFSNISNDKAVIGYYCRTSASFSTVPSNGNFGILIEALGPQLLRYDGLHQRISSRTFLKLAR